MTLPNNPHPGAEHVHFNLGTDRLANPSEIVDMHDPWIDAPHVEQIAEGHPADTHLPEGDMRPWADDLQLPGV